MNFSIKEKGQGLAEYIIILGLVAVVVLAALMVLGPIVEDVFQSLGILGEESPNARLLSDAPIIEMEESHPYYLDGISFSNYNVSYFNPGCETFRVAENKSIKVGSNYSNPSLIVIKRIGNIHYSICNNDLGATVHLVIAIIETPQ